MSDGINSVLLAAIHRSGLSRLSGSPLYSYRLTTEDLTKLRNELRLELQWRPRMERQDYCAAFCLFAAEWFRRNHEDGPWKWEPIFQVGLGLSGDAFRMANTPQNRQRMVQLGLQWWNLPLIETENATEYLVSLACQGGLPLKTLKKDNGNLKSFFEDSLARHEQFPTKPLNDIVDYYADALPVTLNNPVVKLLGGLIIRAVAKLRRDSRTASESAETRIKFLDAQLPRWRDELPLRLDEDDREQLQLLMGLLDKKPIQPATEEFPSVETLLTLGYSTGAITRRLISRKTISEDGLATFLELPDKLKLKPRMTFFLACHGTKTPVAKVSKPATKPEFAIETTGTPVSGVTAIREVRLAAAFGAETLSTVTISGGQDLGDIPWIFVSIGDGKSYRLLGLGSVRTRHESVVVAIPENSSWIEDGDIRPLAKTVNGRRLVQVSGSLEINQDDAVFRVRTKETEDAVALFWLNGRQVTCGMGGTVVWAGMPRILEVGLDGSVLEVAGRSIQWKYERRASDWQTGFSNCRGRVKLRIVRDRATVYQQTIDVVPREFSTKVTPLEPSFGRITLRGLGEGAKVYAAVSDLVTSEVVTSGGETSVRCSLNGSQRPEFVRLKIEFDEKGSVELQVPCPTAWIGLVDAAGQIFTAGRPVPLALFKQLVLRVISPRPHVPQLRSDTNGRHGFLSSLRYSEKDVPGAFELPLSAVATRVSGMMSSTNDMDEKVSLAVTQGVSQEPIFRFQISRYPGEMLKLEPQAADGVGVTFTDVCLPEGMPERLSVSEEQIRIDLSRLARPDRPEGDEACKKIGPFRWRIFHHRLLPGPYLMTAWLDDFVSLRPIRITIKSEETPIIAECLPGSIDEFERTCDIRDRAERRNSWQRLIGGLSQNFGAPAWQRIDATLKSCEYRPMTTFESIIALTDCPLAMARIGILFAGKPWVWERMEELPFLWCLIPIQCWVKAALTIRESQRKLLLQAGLEKEKIDEMLLSQLRRFLEGAVGRPSVLSAAAACLPFADKTIPQDQNFRLLLRNSANSLLQDREEEKSRLISSHAASDIRTSWPLYEVSLPGEAQADAKDLLIDECHDYQKAVLNGPVIAASHSVFGVSVNEKRLSQFQELRGVDPTWFDRCFEITSFILAGRRFEKNEQWIMG